jgi:CRP-like cAMP-binding protein
MHSSNHSAISRFLERLLRRSPLSAEEQAAILALRSHASQVAAHRDIVSLGEQVQHSCLVVEGLVGRFDQMRDGRRQITALHIPGDMCDLHSVVSPIAGWGLEALTTTTILHVPHQDLRNLVTAHPGIALAFWRDTTADASVLAKWIGNLGRRDAASRIAHLFCEVGMRMEQAGLGTRTQFRLPMTQTQIADAMGLTPVHVNRTMQTLRRDQIVRTEQRTIHVDNWARLSEIAEFDPEFLLAEPMQIAA